MIKFLDLRGQYLSIKEEIDTAIADVLSNSAFVGGKALLNFEKKYAEYQGAKYCVGVGNGTDALEIAIESLDLRKGSEIIVPANSFIASAEAISRSGYKVVFCDVNKSDYTLSIDSLSAAITGNTSAIVAVHLYGHPCAMDEIVSIANQHGLKVIEDCAQAHAAEYKTRRVGCIGNVGCFSFYPGKNLGAYGDGGAIVTNDESLSIKARMISNHGRIAKYDHEFEGRNSRLDGLQAAILEVKLRHLDEWTSKRIRLADLYNEILADTEDLVLPQRQSWAKHVYHLFVIRTSKRDRLRIALENAGVQTGIHYPVALPKLKAYRYLKQGDRKEFAWVSDSTLLSLPIGDHMMQEDVEKVCKVIKESQ